jgi:hypothetical protein
MSDSLSVRFEFAAPADHLAYYQEIAVEMVQRWRIDFAAAVAALNEWVRDDDRFGPYAWLLGPVGRRRSSPRCASSPSRPEPAGPTGG